MSDKRSFGMRGSATSKVEVTNISRHGFWVLLDDRELFLPFEKFPWFRNATVEAILEVQRPQPEHLYWPQLDVDLTVDSIEYPERYPLTSRADQVT
jgi:Protein of unknown function (DUF2442)